MKSIEEVYFWIKSGNLKLQHEFHSIDWGDEMNWATGEECRIWFPDKTCFAIGHETRCEMEEDWAEPEVNKVWWIRDITDPGKKGYFDTIHWRRFWLKISEKTGQCSDQD